MKTTFSILILIGFISCSEVTQEVVTLGFEKDLIPEGIAIDSGSKTVFLSSLKKNKIVKCKLDGSSPSDFIEGNQYNYLSGFGMTIKGDTLFALGNSLPKINNKSILLLINIKTGNLINSYSINDSTFIYLNDLVVSSDNDIYITDSESNRIYTIQRSRGELEVFLENDQVAHSNGISISDDAKHLYLASYKTGIRIVDLKSKRIINEPNMDFTGIDGMKYYKNSLIGIVNARRDKSEQGVFRYYLNEDKTMIIGKEKIVPYGEHFKIPTTFDIAGDYIFYTINSQLDNFNQESNQIIDENKLEPYLLMRKKIE